VTLNDLAWFISCYFVILPNAVATKANNVKQTEVRAIPSASAKKCSPQILAFSVV